MLVSIKNSKHIFYPIQQFNCLLKPKKIKKFSKVLGKKQCSRIINKSMFHQLVDEWVNKM